MQTLFTHFAIIDINDTDKMAVIPNIAEGVEGATAFGYSNDYEYLSVEDMQSLPYTVTHTIEIKGLPQSDITENMIHFSDPDVDTYISAIGTDMGLVSVNPVKLEWLVKPNEGNIWHLKATFKSNTGRNTDWETQRPPTLGLKAGGLHIGKNLADVWRFHNIYRHHDADDISQFLFAGNYAQGFTDLDRVGGSFPRQEVFFDPDEATSTSATYYFCAGEKDKGYTEIGHENLEQSFFLFLPYEGRKVTFSLEIDEFDVDPEVQVDLILDKRNPDQTGDGDLVTEEIVGTGKYVIEAQLDEDAPWVAPALRVWDRFGNATSVSEIDFSEPSVRIDGGDEYVQY